MKTLPLIRHIRWAFFIIPYIWKAVNIYSVEDVEEMREHLYPAEFEHATEIWEGRA